MIQLTMPNIKEYCIVDKPGLLHESVTVWPFTQIRGDVHVGAGSTIGCHVNLFGFESPIHIGRNTTIQAYCIIPHGCRIGNNVFMASGANICNDKYPPSDPADWEPITVEDDVVIGVAVTFLPGVLIGQGAKIGCGSVVTKDVAPGAVVCGNPARVIRSKW